MRIATAVLATLSIAVAACSGTPTSTSAPSGGAPSVGVPSAPPSAGTTAMPSVEPSGQPSEAAATRIEVTLTDTLRIEPSEMRVPRGVPVTFVVTNTGVLEHEFYIGDEEAQAAHEAEMAAMGGMTHDDPEGIGVEPGETRELTYTFLEAGPTLAGCHVQGHYFGGMKAVITVE